MPGGLSRKDCAIVPGLDTALCFAFRSDNLGPPANFEVITSMPEKIMGSLLSFPKNHLKSMSQEKLSV